MLYSDKKNIWRSETIEEKIIGVMKELDEARSDLREQEKTCMTCKHGRVLCLKTEDLFDDDEPCIGSWEEK